MRAGDSAQAVLMIPAHATPQDCWHEMSVLANGETQWRRRVPSHNAGAFNGLD